VGYHLFGETYKRSVFLLGLKQRYRALGFAMDAAELPDRLSVVLRFLACCPDDALRDELIDEAVLPALGRMSAADRASQPPAGADSCAPELEGHSHGDVLEGGFLLRLIEGDRGEGDAHPYWRALQALRLVLSSARGESPAAATA
jgi:nitrate reductase delta subunit